MSGIDGICRAILDGHHEPIVFVDTEHVIRYVNEAGAIQYQKDGGYALVGRSVMDCHNERSCRVIREVFARMLNDGVDEEEIYRRPGKIAYMTAVRDGKGTLLGYYERYAMIHDQ